MLERITAITKRYIMLERITAITKRYHARAEHHSYNKALSCRSAHQPVLVCGGFNTCNIRLTSLLPNLHEYVTCPTCLNKTVDMCCGNIPGLYSDSQTVTLYMCILNTQKLKTA